MTDVALALLRRGDRWFLQRRDPANAVLPGLWEFPGGKAEAGEIAEFTGVSSPYEAPGAPELVLETDLHAVEDLVARAREYLQAKGLVD